MQHINKPFFLGGISLFINKIINKKGFLFILELEMKSVLKRIHRGISERSEISISAAQTSAFPKVQCLFHDIAPIDCCHASSFYDTKINKKSFLFGR
jgi:hypothetical protein